MAATNAKEGTWSSRSILYSPPSVISMALASIRRVIPAATRNFLILLPTPVAIPNSI